MHSTPPILVHLCLHTKYYGIIIVLASVFVPAGTLLRGGDALSEQIAEPLDGFGRALLPENHLHPDTTGNYLQLFTSTSTYFHLLTPHTVPPLLTVRSRYRLTDSG